MTDWVGSLSWVLHWRGEYLSPVSPKYHLQCSRRHETSFNNYNVNSLPMNPWSFPFIKVYPPSPLVLCRAARAVPPIDNMKPLLKRLTEQRPNAPLTPYPLHSTLRTFIWLKSISYCFQSHHRIASHIGKCYHMYLYVLCAPTVSVCSLCIRQKVGAVKRA